MSLLLLVVCIIAVIGYAVLWGIWYEHRREFALHPDRAIPEAPPTQWWQEPTPPVPILFKTPTQENLKNVTELKAAGLWLSLLSLRYWKQFCHHVGIKIAEIREAAVLRSVRQAAEAKVRWEASPAGKHDAALREWAAEVEVLREQMGSPPPERLQANVKVYEWKEPYTDYQGKQTGSWTTRYYVDLFLMPSEEERAIIRKFGIDQILIEDRPRYSPEEIVQWEAALKGTSDRIAAQIRGRADPSVLYEDIPDRVNERRVQRIRTSLGEYFDFPHFRGFDTMHEAHTYASKLREEFLPKIRGLIEEYRTRRDEETFSL